MVMCMDIRVGMVMEMVRVIARVMVVATVVVR